VGGQKAGQTRGQPGDSKTDGRADRQDTHAAPAKHFQGSGGKPFESIINLGQIGRSSFGQHQTARQAFEKGFAQVML